MAEEPRKHLRTFRSKKLPPEHVAIMNQAIRNNARGKEHDVHIHYTKADGTKIKRKIRPIAVRGTNLLLAHDHKRGEVRSFRMDRVQMSKHASLTALLYPYAVQAEPHIELGKVMLAAKAKNFLKGSATGQRVLRLLTKLKRKTVTTPAVKALLGNPAGRTALEVVSDFAQYKTPSLDKYKSVYKKVQDSVIRKELLKSAEDQMEGFWRGFEKRAADPKKVKAIYDQLLKEAPKQIFYATKKVVRKK